MGWGVICKQAVAPSEDGTNALLRRFPDLKDVEMLTLIFLQ